MDYVLETFRGDWEAFLSFAPKLFYAAVVFGLTSVIARFSGRTIEKLLTRQARSYTNLLFVRHVVTWSIGLIGLLLALGVLGFQGVATSMLATGGVVAIVAGFAFREIGENFLAGFFLSFSRPFELKDLIKTGDLTGTVSGIALRHVHIRTFDGCDVFVPSAQIFREPLFNYTRDGLRRPSFSIGVAYHDSPEEVKALLLQATGKVDEVLKKPPYFINIDEFGSGYIVYEVFFWIDVNDSKRNLVEIRNEVKINCWRALKEAGMTFSTDVSTGIDIQSMPELQISQAGERPDDQESQSKNSS